MMSQLDIQEEGISSSARQERFLVLFEDALLVLSASKRMSCFVYLVRISFLTFFEIRLFVLQAHSGLAGLKLNLIDELSMEIYGKSFERKTVTFKTVEDAQKWVKALEDQINKANTRLPPMDRANTLPKPVSVLFY